MLALTIGAVMAQPKAIGARLGYNFEVSYQHNLPTGMLEVDAGLSPFIFQKGYILDENGNKIPQTFHYGRAEIIAIYDWTMNIANSLNWYVGLAAGVSWGYGDFFNSEHYNKNGNLTTYSRLGLPVGAQIGLEYDFNFPMNLSIDYRPMINLFGLRQGDLTSNLLNIALGIRYRF